MPFETHNFLRGKRSDIVNDVGHVFMELLPLDLLWYAREWTTVRLLWPYKGQMPPGMPAKLATGLHDKNGVPLFETYYPADRVHDKARDHFGAAIGKQLRTLILIGLLAWRW